MSDLDAAIRAKLAEFVDDHLLIGEYGSPTGPGHDEMRAAIEAVLDLHKPTYYDGQVDYERHEEPVFSADGKPRGTIEVRGNPLPPDWCDPCAAVVPCDEVRAIAGKLGVEVDGG